MSDWRYFQVVEILEQKEIDHSRYDILIDGASLNGEPISGACISTDGRWACLPVHDEEGEMLSGEYCYRPQCFEVMVAYDMWVSSDGYMQRVEVHLLRR